MRRYQLVVVFGCALLVRLLYVGLLLAFDGGFSTPDTRIYLGLGQSILDLGRFGSFSADGVFIPHTTRMPIYPHFVALIIWLAGDSKILAIVLAQAVLDSLTVVAIAYGARAMNPRWFWPAAVCAALLPNLVVHSTLVMADTLFVTIYTWGIAIALQIRRDRPVWPLIFGVGACFSLALVTREVLMFFGYFVVPALAYMLAGRLGISWKRALLMAMLPIVMMGASVAHRYIQTHHTYGIASISNHSGGHALFWVYPSLRTTWGWGDIKASANEINILLNERLATLPPEYSKNRGLKDQVERKLALELVQKLPLTQIAKGLFAGAFMNIGDTGLSTAGYQFGLKQLPISKALSGSNGAQRLENFLNMFKSKAFTLLWLVAILGVAASRLIQLFGLIKGTSNPETRHQMVFLIITALYFLCINLSIGYSRYRLPMEPAFVITLAAGLDYLAIKWADRRSRLVAG